MGNRTYTLSEYETAITHVLAGVPNINCPAIDTVNRSITWVCNQSEWSWRLKNLPPINILNQNLASPGSTPGTWAFDPTTNANVTGSTAWAAAGNPPIYRDNLAIVWVYYPNHGLAPGSYISVSGVTPTSGDQYPFNCTITVNTVPDANTFTYQIPGQFAGGAVQDITVPQNTSAPLYGYWVAGDYQLPLDFAGMKTLASMPGAFRNVYATTVADLYEKRQINFGTTYEIYYACGYYPQTVVTVEPQPVIMFFPVPTLVNPSFLSGMYRRRIPELVNPTDIADVPSQFNDLIWWACRAFAKSSEFDQVGTDWQMVNSMLEAYKHEDGMIQQPMTRLRTTVQADHGSMPVNPSFYPTGNIPAG